MIRLEEKDFGIAVEALRQVPMMLISIGNCASTLWIPAMCGEPRNGFRFFLTIGTTYSESCEASLALAQKLGFVPTVQIPYYRLETS